jgi:diguanylate cyclase (GGDEF)-like protein
MEHRISVLVVDEAPGGGALADLLKNADYAVRSCADGVEALRILGGTGPGPGGVPPPGVDMVVIDLGISGTDAFSVLRTLRSAEKKRHVPVVLVSTRADRELRLTAFRLGADELLGKPWDADEVLARLGRLVQVKRKVDEALEECAELQKGTLQDSLTLLGNQRFFEARLQEEFRRARRYHDPLSLLLLDLDHFKAVNDRLGHPAGDEVLKEVAAVVKRAVRDTDVVARHGGDEFSALLPKTSLASALTVAERIWRDVAALPVRQGPAALTLSVGISAFPNRSVLTADQLFRTADEALFQAKREGRNRIALYPPAPPNDAPPEGKS